MITGRIFIRRKAMLEYVERKGTDCSKWDGLESTFGADGLLPLWVADMDFSVDSHIKKALADYMDTGVYGYPVVSDGYYEAFIDWEKSVHGFTVDREWIRYSPVSKNALFSKGSSEAGAVPAAKTGSAAAASRIRHIAAARIFFARVMEISPFFFGSFL